MRIWGTQKIRPVKYTGLRIKVSPHIWGHKFVGGSSDARYFPARALPELIYLVISYRLLRRATRLLPLARLRLRFFFRFFFGFGPPQKPRLGFRLPQQTRPAFFLPCFLMHFLGGLGFARQMPSCPFWQGPYSPPHGRQVYLSFLQWQGPFRSHGWKYSPSEHTTGGLQVPD